MAQRQRSPGPTLVSVVIPSYKDRDGLLRTLRALASQTLPAASFEVLVVDNAPTFELKDLDSFPGLAALRVLHEPQPGSYAARNRGLAAARGDLLAFTDADCEPAPDWLERARAAAVGSDAVAGAIEVFPRVAGRPNAVEAYEMDYAFPQEASVRRLGYGVTANLVATRRTMDGVGPFRDDLRSGGDRDWCHRLRAAGLQLRYHPEVVVRHPARHSARNLAGKVRRHLGGKLDLQGRLRFTGGVLYSALALWGAMGGLVVRGRLRPWQAPQALALAIYLDGALLSEAARLLAGGARRR